MKEDLQRIANTLVLYSYHVTGNGLFAGRSGIIWYLYNYSQYIGNEYYNDFAGNLLDKVLNESGNTSADFENGLSGIGWMVNRLLKEDLVDGTPNEVLERVDHIVFDRMTCNPDISLFGQAIYLKERLKDNPDVQYFEEHIDNILSICLDGLQGFGGKISLYHINSVLSFLIEIDKNQKFREKINAIRQLLPNTLKKIKDQKLVEITDEIIFNQLLASIPKDEQYRWKDVNAYKTSFNLSQLLSIEQYIRIAWMQYLYFGKVNIETPDNKQIKNFIDRKQTSITLDDFLFKKGLAGLGYALLASNK